MTKRISWLLASFLAFLSWGVWTGCGAGGGSGFDDDDGQGAGIGSGGTGASGGWNPGEDDGGLQDGDICEGEEIDSIMVELDVFLVIDHSGSMYPEPWPETRDALKTFFDRPEAVDINLALIFFPHPTLGDSCNVSYYLAPNSPQFPQSIPPMARIPADNVQLKATLDALPDAPSSNMTPMRAALDGTYQMAGAWMGANPNHKVIVVLSGDGMPNQCGPLGAAEVTECANLTAAAYNGLGLETYAVILDSAAQDAMDEIAAAGNTNTAYNVANDVSQFAQVMADIRNAALGCEFIIPEPTDQDFDKTKVNVHYYPGGVGDGQQLPQVTNAAACGSGPGWYFDDPLDPSRILLCPQSCTLVTNDPAAKIRIQFGCPTTSR